MNEHYADTVRGLDALQKLLDRLPAEDPTCRNAWCGEWERSNGEYEPHPAHIDGSGSGANA